MRTRTLTLTGPIVKASGDDVGAVTFASDVEPAEERTALLLSHKEWEKIGSPSALVVTYEVVTTPEEGA